MSSFGVQGNGFLLMVLSPTAGGGGAVTCPCSWEKFAGGVHSLQTFSQPCTYYRSASCTHAGRRRQTPRPRCLTPNHSVTSFFFPTRKKKVTVLGRTVPITHKQAPVVVFCHTSYTELTSLLLALWILGRQRSFRRRRESLGLCGMLRSSAVMWGEKGNIGS